MKFEDMLQESYTELEEASNPMTMEQKKTVAKFKKHGWYIYDRDHTKVIMMKDDHGKTKEVFIYTSGKTFFINESIEHDITELVDEVLEEGLFGDIASFFKRAFDNLTTVALVRGNSTVLATMSRSRNEYAEMENGQVVKEGQFSNRKSAMAFVETLKEAGYQETSFESVVPRSIGKSLKFALRTTPTILITLLIYSYFPGASWVVNALANGAWRIIFSALSADQELELEAVTAALKVAK